MKSTSTPFFIFAALIALTLVFTSCNRCVEGDGEVTTKKFDVENFTKLEVELDAVVVLMKGEPSVTIEAQPNILTLITPTVKRGTLHVRSTSCVNAGAPIKITITSPIFEEISLEGKVSVSSVNLITVKELEINAQGDCYIKLNVFVNDLSVDMVGDCLLELTGNCQQADIELTGSSVFDGFGFNASIMSVQLEGAGKASVSVLNKLRARVDGSGEIIYSGDPQVDVKINGNGKVTKVN